MTNSHVEDETGLVHLRVEHRVQQMRDPDLIEFRRGGAIGLPLAEGRWQTRSLFVFDARERSLIRRTYTVWNTLPMAELDFNWIPASVKVDAPGRITGTGRLIWRAKGKAAYDHSSVKAEYLGAMQDGRPNGQGVYCDRIGFRYEGDWAVGQIEGNGRLQLPNGDEFRGSFFRGKAHGQGIYFQSDGEIHDGWFEQGLRHGPARLTLPNGTIYLSTWNHGKEVAYSQNVRLAQLGSPIAAADEIRLGVLVDNSPLKKGMLGYSSTQAIERLVVQPADERLMELWKGSADIELTSMDMDPERGGLFSWQTQDGGGPWSPAVLPPVAFVLNIENKREQPIAIVDAYLEVAKSFTDFEPLVVITYEPCPQTEFDPTVIINNYGWGPLEEATLRLAFTSPGKVPEATELVWTKKVGSIAATATVSVEEKLREAGIDVDTLKRRNQKFHCPSKSQTECFSDLVHSQTFGQSVPYLTLKYDIFVVANLTGFLEYKWRDDQGQIHARRSRCTVQPTLGSVEPGAECEGGDIEAIKTTPLMLKADGEHYRTPFEFRTTIAPGRVARYSLPIRAPKSSRHDLRTVVVLADGREIRSRPIDLLYFLPNTWGQKKL